MAGFGSAFRPELHLRVLGIDPGFAGALALIDSDGPTLRVERMPVYVEARSRDMTFLDLVALTKLFREWKPDVAYIEDVFSSPQMGVAGVFSFGEGKGSLKGILAALDVPTRFCSPSRWKGDLGCTSDKNQTKRVARALFPSCQKILRSEGKCEAALIALWGAFDQGLTGPLLSRTVPAPSKS